MTSAVHHLRRNRPLAGVLFALGAMSLFSWQDSLIKHLTGHYSLFQILFVRSAVIVASLACILFFRNGTAAFRTARPLDHAKRVTFNLLAFLSYYYALTRIDLAQATAIALSSPLFAIGLSGILLKERAGAKQFAVAGFGFVGVILVIQPVSDSVDWIGTAAALFAALMFAMLFVQTRKMTTTETTGLMVFYAGATFFCLTGLIMPSQWVTPVGFDWVLLFGLAAVSLIAQLCIVQASQFAPIHVIAPFEYVTILWALFLGWYFFAEVPTALMLVGAAVVIACGLAIIRIEHGKSSSSA